MRVFVTGAAGYAGSAIVHELAERGHEAICLVRKGFRFRNGRVQALADTGDRRVRIVQGDLLKPDTYRDALAAADAVIHLAGIIREAPSRGVTFERIHVEGTARLLDTCAKSGFSASGSKRLIHMSANSSTCWPASSGCR